MSCGTTARNCAGRLRPQFHRRPSAALSGRAPESATAAGDAYLRIVAHMHPFERAPHPATDESQGAGQNNFGRPIARVPVRRGLDRLV
jgi:hypothetical protein